MGVDVITIERSFEPPPTVASDDGHDPAGERLGRAQTRLLGRRRRGNGAAPRGQSAGGGRRVAGVDGHADRRRAASATSRDRSSSPYLKAPSRRLPRSRASSGLRVDGVKGKVPQNLQPIGRARVALYKPWTENIDEGWTRWLLDQYEFKYATTHRCRYPRAAICAAQFDAIILPNVVAGPARVRVIRPDAVPREYSGGLDRGRTSTRIKTFVRAGGTLICLGAVERPGDRARSSCRFAMSRARPTTGCSCPVRSCDSTSIPSQPLAYGMEPHTAAFFAFSSAFEGIAGARSGDGPCRRSRTRRRHARPSRATATRDLLLSGWLEGEEIIAGRAAVVQATVGTGHVVLLGFPVQHRGQSHATFRLLFNAIFSAR